MWLRDLTRRSLWAKKQHLLVASGDRPELGMIRGRYLEVDRMEEIVKYAINCFLNDGLLGCFVNSIVLNNRLIKICRELDALGFDSNVFSNFNSSRGDGDKEKDRALLERRGRGRGRGRRRRRREETREKEMKKSREDLSLDLRSEVILGSTKASGASIYPLNGSACKRTSTYDSPSNEKIDRTECTESQGTFQSGEMHSRRSKNSSNLARYDGSDNAERCSRVSSRDDGKVKKKKRRCRCSISLKPRTRGRRRLSLPFKADVVTREIFKVHPTLLRESCPIATKRKFEMGISNLCSCLNDVVRKIFGETVVADLRLILDVRRGYANFKLTGRRSQETRSCLLFVNRIRVPIRRRAHNLDVGVIGKAEIGPIGQVIRVLKTDEKGNEKDDLSIEEKEDGDGVEERRRDLSVRIVESSMENNIGEDSSRMRPTTGKRLDVDPTTCLSNEEIPFDRTTECSCLLPPSCETPPIVLSHPSIDENASNIFNETNSSSSNICDGSNLTKSPRKEGQEQVEEKEEEEEEEDEEDHNIIEDICNQRLDRLEPEGIVRTIDKRDENEEIVGSRESSRSMDGLTTEIIFSKGETNVDCDSKCSCRSKVSSIFSYAREKSVSSEISKNVVVKKIESALIKEIERAENSFERETNRVLCSASRENHREYVVVTSSKRYVDAGSIVIDRRKSSRSRSKEKLREERFRGEESSRTTRKKDSTRRPFVETVDCDKERFLFGKYKNSLPYFCTCDSRKLSYDRNRRRGKLSMIGGESRTSKIENYDDGLRGAFCPGTFYAERRSIGGRLRNMVRANLSRFVRRDKGEEEEEEEEEEEVKESADDRCYSRPSRMELRIRRRRRRRRRRRGRRRRENERDRKGMRAKNSYGRTRPEKHFDRIAIYDLRTSIDDRSTMDRRSTTYSLSNVEEGPSSIRRYYYYFLPKRNFTHGERGRKSKEIRNDRKTYNIDNGKGLEFVFDRSSCENSNEILSNERLVNDYEKSIGDLGLNFRSKLEQYVALCKNIKYSLLGNVTKGEER